jgi:RHS repeat-associated protein
MTNDTGVVKARYDFLAFGQEILPPNPPVSGSRSGVLCGSVSCYSQSGAITQKFTCKEKDAETGLDYFIARYDSTAHGRFTSADLPLIDQYPSDPQSWNLYSYVRNSPMVYVDLDGHCVPGTEDCPESPPNQGPDLRTIWCWFFNCNGNTGIGDNQPRGNPPGKAAPPVMQKPPANCPPGSGVALGAGVNADLGLVAGASATGSVGAGVFRNRQTGTSAGAYASGGAAVTTGRRVAQVRVEDDIRVGDVGLRVPHTCSHVWD